MFVWDFVMFDIDYVLFLRFVCIMVIWVFFLIEKMKLWVINEIRSRIILIIYVCFKVNK